MPKPKTQPTPAWLESARAHYAEAFDHKRKRDLQNSMEEWGELTEDEQSFSVAHLLYLNLQAQAAGQKLLVQVRDLLEEVAENLTTAIEESLPQGEPADDEVQAEEPSEVEEDDLVVEPPPAPVASEGGGA